MESNRIENFLKSLEANGILGDSQMSVVLSHEPDFIGGTTNISKCVNHGGAGCKDDEEGDDFTNKVCTNTKAKLCATTNRGCTNHGDACVDAVNSVCSNVSRDSGVTK